MGSPITPPEGTGDPLGRRGRLLCGWAAAALTACGAVVLGLVEAGWGPLRSADLAMAADLHRTALGHPSLTHANRILTDWVWAPLAMRLLAMAVVAFLAWRRAYRLALWVVAATLVGAAVQDGVKAAVGRGRPLLPHPVDSATNAAFPSGHAMTATVVCGLLLALVHLLVTRRRALWTAAAWALAAVSVLGVGFTRLFLGVHWFSDVLAGWLLGGAVLAATAACCAPWRGAAARGWRG